MFETVLDLIRQLARDGDLPAALASGSLGPDTRLGQMGIDSVGKVNLLLAIDERLGIYIPDDQLVPDMTLGALADRIGVDRAGSR